MKRQLLVLGVATVLFAACHNSNSSTVAEKDGAYQRSFHHDKSESHHTSPAEHKQATDHNNSHEPADTAHAQH